MISISERLQLLTGRPSIFTLNSRTRGNKAKSFPVLGEAGREETVGIVIVLVIVVEHLLIGVVRGTAPSCRRVGGSSRRCTHPCY